MSKPPPYKPENVTEAAAEDYLLMTGWVRFEGFKARQWARSGVRFTRGEAVMRQYAEDFSRLLFVLQHSPPEARALLAAALLSDRKAGP